MQEWGADRIDDLTELCERAMPAERLLADELLALCWEDDGIVLGLPDGSGAAAAVSRTFGDLRMAWVKLVVVDPDRQRQGSGAELLAAVESWAFDLGSLELHLSGSPPWYVWPGVPTDALGMLCLAEARGFDHTGCELNMAIPTRFRATAPEGVVVRRASGDEDVAAVDAFVQRHWANWVDETRRGIEQGGVHAAWRGREVVGFACHSVNRAGWIGPMGTDPAGQGVGTGSALLGALCEDLMVAGFAAGEIAWVGPVRFYAKCGADVSRAFRTYRKRRP